MIFIYIYIYIIIIDFKQSKTIVNSTYYVSLRKLKDKIRTKCRGKLPEDIRFMHDSVCAHIVAISPSAFRKCEF